MSVIKLPGGKVLSISGKAILLATALGGTVPPPTPTPTPMTLPPGITNSVTNPGADGYGPGIYFPIMVYARTADVDGYDRVVGTGFARLETRGGQAWSVLGTNPRFVFLTPGFLTIHGGTTTAGDAPITIQVTDGTTTKTQQVTVNFHPQNAVVGCKLLLDTVSTSAGFKEIPDLSNHFAILTGQVNCDAGGITGWTLTDPAGRIQVNATAPWSATKGLCSTEVAYPLVQHYGRSDCTLTLRYTSGPNQTQALPVWIVQEQPAAVSFVSGQINRWAVANHHDRLAIVTSYCVNAAGRIQGVAQTLPPGVDRNAIKAALIAEAARAGMAEFDKTGSKVGATPQKLAGLIKQQLGVLPVAVIEAAVPSVAAAVVDALVPDVVVPAPAVPFVADPVALLTPEPVPS